MGRLTGVVVGGGGHAAPRRGAAVALARAASERRPDLAAADAMGKVGGGAAGFGETGGEIEIR